MIHNGKKILVVNILSAIVGFQGLVRGILYTTFLRTFFRRLKVLSSNYPRLRTFFSRFFFSSDLFSSGLFLLRSYFLRLYWKDFRKKSPRNSKHLAFISSDIFSKELRIFGLFSRSFYFQVFSRNFFPGTFLHRFTNGMVEMSYLMWGAGLPREYSSSNKSSV